MKKQKNNFKDKRNRTGDVEYSENILFKEKLIVTFIRKLEIIIISLLIIIAISLFIIAKCNEAKHYIWFGKKDTLILYLLSIFSMFASSPLVFLFEIIAEKLD